MFATDNNNSIFFTELRRKFLTEISIERFFHDCVLNNDAFQRHVFISCHKVDVTIDVSESQRRCKIHHTGSLQENVFRHRDGLLKTKLFLGSKTIYKKVFELQSRFKKKRFFVPTTVY